jgi:hypothetical protein
LNSIVPLNKFFDGNQIRVFEQDDEVWIAVADIAFALGMDRTSMHDLIKRNHEIFDGFTRSVGITLTEQKTANSKNINNALFCVNEQGCYTLLGKIQVSRIKDPERRKAIVKFQRWIPELVQAFRKGELTRIGPSGVPPVLEEQLQIANLMSTHAGIDRGIAVSLAIAKTKQITGTDYLEPYEKFLLPGDADASPSLNATDIGHAIGGIGPRETNALLEAMGFHQKVNGKWVVTEKGKPFFSPLPFSKAHANGSIHSDIQNKWKPNIIDEIRGFQNRIGMPCPRSLFDTEWSS